jgi:MSHA biogenesis protein MshN
VLAAEPRHEPARRALAALHTEAGARDAALATLLEGVSLEPTRFAAAAATLQVELGDAAGALATLARVPAAARSARIEALHGGIAQRSGRHEMAIESYRRAIALGPVEPAWWIGLAVSLESIGARADALGAYERAAATPTLAAELRPFVTQKLAALAPARAPADEPRVSARP